LIFIILRAAWVPGQRSAGPSSTPRYLGNLIADFNFYQ